MVRFIQTRLEFKILLLIIAVLLAGFGSYVVLTIQKESEALLNQQHEKLQIFSESVSAGIRNVMLTGKAPFASALVNDIRENLPFGAVTIYDRFGREVFLREGEGVLYNVQDSSVHEALRTSQMRSRMIREGSADVFLRYEPIANRPECWRCHDPKEPMRGVLQLALRPETIQRGDREKAIEGLAGTMGEFIATAFRTIMLGGQGEMMDTLTANVSSIPGVRRVQVYAKDGWRAFGPEEDELMEEEILDVLKNNSTAYRFGRKGEALRLFLPLANEERCQVCHGSKFPMRGVMVVDFDRNVLRNQLGSGAKSVTASLQTTVFEGFRSIMLVGRASSTRYYMDALRNLPLVHTLKVFDKEGNERFLNPPPRKRGQLSEVVKARQASEFLEQVGDEEYLVRLAPLANEVRCYSCHGKNHDTRAVVEVAASMREINATVEENKVRSAGIGILTILIVWGVIRLFMKSVVVRPVQLIADVAQQVGEGNFSVHAEVGSRDEIGGLARRINEMVQGLRERFHLQKFVSEQTVKAVRAADVQGVKLGGVRKLATVFFSDIRGFTAFSEKTEPEKVVAMLNICLSRQASIVRKYKGDIDKFVGDELVAVFEGEEMVENAVRAAKEIQLVMGHSEPAGKGTENIKVGIGINTGEMVMGAMGSADRMDYTVIGDNVNLGARLCGVAAPGQILLSEFSARYLEGHGDLHLKQLDSIPVKGKTAPVRVYEVLWE